MTERIARIMFWTVAIATALAVPGAALAELASGPTAEAVKGDTVIRFQLRAATDVEVSILNAKGQVVRHLAAGMLGGQKAPPPPLVAGLSQSVRWDGKDDGGKPAVGGPFKARVRTGLRPSFDRFIGSSPASQGGVAGLACDAEGNVYVMSTWSAPNGHYPAMEIKSFTRDGKYRRQIMPYRASLPKDRLASVPQVKLADGSSAPIVYHGTNHSLHPQSGTDGRSPMLVRPDGHLVTVNSLMGDGPYGFDDATRRVIVFGNDGGAAGDHFGPLIAHSDWRGGAHITLALSPDGKTIYAAGYRNRSVPVPAVTRTTWDATGEPEVFLGDPAKSGAEPHGLIEPRGLAVDAKGNLYVCDNAAGRVAVFSPEGKLIGQIPVENPDSVAVNRKTGKVYVLTVKPLEAVNHTGNWGQGRNWAAGKRLLMFAGPDAKTPLASHDLRNSPAKTVFALDDSRDQAVLWVSPIVYGNPDLMRLADAGDSFGAPEFPLRDLRRPENLDVGYLELAVDRNTDELIVGRGSARRFDGRTGEFLGTVSFTNVPKARTHYAQTWGSFVFDAAGSSILYQPAWKWLFRFDRQGKPVAWPGRGDGERAEHEVDGDLEQGFMHARGLASARDGSFYVLHHTTHRNFNNGRVSQVGADGKVIRSEIVKTDVPVGGVRVDRQGNIYVGVHLKPGGKLLPEWFQMLPNGHLLPPPKAPAGWGAGPGQLPPEVMTWYAEQYGSLVKFGPDGGQLVFDDKGEYFAPVLGGERSNWSPEWRTGRGAIKAEGEQWMWYGLSPMPSRRGTSRTLGGPRCSCQTPRFDLDGHDRVYVPDVFRAGVAVLDSAGNLITRFGQYGNQDDPAEGTVIPLAWPHAVAASEQAVYVADMVNHRVTRVRLDAASEAMCELP